MEQKDISCGSVCDRLPALSAKYPWLVAQNLKGETKDQIFYTMHDLKSHYRCQIPELLGRCIQGCFHGWVILSNNNIWSLWNPVTSETICLPPLILKDGDFESIKQCCLSSPPNDRTSVLMLTRTKTPAIAFFRLDRKRKSLTWKEMTYAKQLKSIVGDVGFLHCLTCCNGKVYALVSCSRRSVIQLDIVVKGKEVVISLSAFLRLPLCVDSGSSAMKSFLRGCCKDLFFIKLGFDKIAKKTLGAIYLFKLDTTSMIWEEMEDLKDAIFFLDLARDCSVFYRDTIASELGGYVHILGEMGKILYSYNFKDKTISLSSMLCLEQSTHLSLWECGLHCDQECGTADEIMPVRDYTRNEEPHIIKDIPHDVLGMIMEFFAGVDYLNFRATCKYLTLAAPISRLQTYPINSPWLLVVDKHKGIITFTDPMSCNKYFIKLPQELIGDLRICFSRDGWLLLYKLLNGSSGELFFYNPFTKDIRKLPNVPCLDSLYFKAPPTSPDCKVVGLSTSLPLSVFIYSLTWESWARYPLVSLNGMTPHSFLSTTLFNDKILALNQEELNLVVPYGIGPDAYMSAVLAKAPRGNSAQYYLVNSYRGFLLVAMDELGEFVEVFSIDPTLKWEKLDSLGRDMIYICGTTCLCMEAKTPEMENKIYFPRLDSKYGKIVFYSLETRKYHTLNGKDTQQCFDDFIGTKYYVNPHAWIQPTWS